MHVNEFLNSKQLLLREIIKDEERFDEAVALCLEIHSLLHSADVSSLSSRTFADDVFEDLDDTDYSVMPTKRDVTIAWNLWHTTRIEDIASNILMTDSIQVLDDYWIKAINTNILDTDNAMTDHEIIGFSQNINISALQQYRSVVAKQTRKILDYICFQDFKRKISTQRLERVLSEGAVTNDENSIWLLDYWRKKTIAGIILMPLTRHQIVHLNDCVQLKKKIQKIKFSSLKPSQRA